MNKDELIIPNDWGMDAVKLGLTGYDAEGNDVMFLVATDKDGKTNEFAMKGEAMKAVALEAYKALKAGSTKSVHLRFLDGSNHLYSLYLE